MRSRLVAGLLVTASLGVAAAVTLVMRDVPGDVDPGAASSAVDSSGATAAEEPLEDLVGDDGSPLLGPDGRPFPAGSRREGRRRIVAPDGRVWVRERGHANWRISAARAETGRPVRTEKGRRGGWQLDVGKGLRNLRDARGLLVAAEPAANVRPPVWLAPGSVPVIARPQPGSQGAEGEAVLAPVVPAFPEADATFTHSSDRAPRLDLVPVPEARGGRRRVAAEDERAEAEEEHVVAQHGLRADYYDFLAGSIHDIPDLTTLPPTFTRIDLSIDFGRDEDFKLPFHPETFATLWRGTLRVPEAGEYTFTMGSDDGVRLTIGSQVVVEHARLRAYSETDGVVTLTAGVHPIEVVFYENFVFASCRLFWTGPSWEKRVVEPRFFAPPAEVAGIVQPHVTRIEPVSARLGDEVVLRGVGFADTAALNRVTFAGVPAEIVSATSDELVVVVPIGAETGDVVAQVGPLSSLPRAFQVDSINGLFGEYFLLGEDLAEYPDFNTLAPYFVRLDGPLDYHQDGLWELPYAPDVFAARYTGYIWFPAEDDYRITLGCDDGAALSIDGEAYLEDPGLHAYREVTRTSHFTRGFHAVEIIFFENRGVARLRLFWQRPHELERAVIPRGFLFPPEELTDLPEPELTTTHAAGPLGAALELTGSGFGEDPRLVRVHFPGDVWARPIELEDRRLVVRIPLAVGTGDLRVEVGVRSSNAAAFERTTPMGLTADYYVFSTDEELRTAAGGNNHRTALAERSPNLSRVETSWRRGPDGWDVPFPTKRMAVHWHGQLGSPQIQRLVWILQADDGAYLYVDGRRIVDNGPFHGLSESSGNRWLGVGEHRVDLYYFQLDGEAQMHLYWNAYGIAAHNDVPARWIRPDDE